MSLVTRWTLDRDKTLTLGICSVCSWHVYICMTAWHVEVNVGGTHLPSAVLEHWFLSSLETDAAQV